MYRQFGYGLMVLALAQSSGRVARAAVSHGPGQHGGLSRSSATQGYLGIDVRDVAEEQVSILKLRDAHGAEITRVDHDGPAGKMGLREHDVVVQMNGVAVEGEEQIRRMLHESAPGRTLVLVISRDGQQQTVTAQLADKATIEKQAWEQHLAPPAGPQAPASGLPNGESAAISVAPSSPSLTSRYSKSLLGTLLMTPSYTGVMLKVLGPQLAESFGVQGGKGLLVWNVESNSPAEVAGLRAGDVVIRANQHRVGTMSDWNKAIREAKGRPVAVTLVRDKQERTLTLTPDGRKHADLELPEEPDHSFRCAQLTEL